MSIMIGIGISPSLNTGGGGVTTLRREADGTVTIVSLARVWVTSPSRQPDGTVTVH